MESNDTEHNPNDCAECLAEMTEYFNATQGPVKRQTIFLSPLLPEWDENSMAIINGLLDKGKR